MTQYNAIFRAGIRVFSAASRLRRIQKRRQRDEQEFAASGVTYDLNRLNEAESDLDKALDDYTSACAQLADNSDGAA